MIYYIFMQADEVFGTCFDNGLYRVLDGMIGVGIVNSNGQLREVYLGRTKGRKVYKRQEENS
jgi:hypothetical protein